MGFFKGIKSTCLDFPINDDQSVDVHSNSIQRKAEAPKPEPNSNSNQTSEPRAEPEPSGGKILSQFSQN